MYWTGKQSSIDFLSKPQVHTDHFVPFQGNPFVSILSLQSLSESFLEPDFRSQQLGHHTARHREQQQEERSSWVKQVGIQLHTLHSLLVDNLLLDTHLVVDRLQEQDHHRHLVVVS